MSVEHTSGAVKGRIKNRWKTCFENQDLQEVCKNPYHTSKFGMSMERDTESNECNMD